jgi:universal stress protein E
VGVRLERAVAGIDFGEASVAAARWAATRLAPKAELVLVHVLHVEEPRWIRPRLPRKQVLTLAREAAERRLRELTRTIGAPLVFTEVVVGDPADRIAAVASEFEADLVVVGPHGGRPSRWTLLGSTAERVIRASDRAVLVVREPSPRQPRRILVPVDDLQLPARVRRWMTSLNTESGETVVLTVVPSVADAWIGSPLLAWGHVPAHDAALRHQVSRWLERMRRDLGFRRRNLVPVVEFGDPGRAIVEFARAHGTDLVVLSTRGAGAVRRAVLGSVTGSVIRGAPCPVLVVPLHAKRGTRRRTRRPRRFG